MPLVKTPLRSSALRSGLRAVTGWGEHTGRRVALTFGSMWRCMDFMLIRLLIIAYLLLLASPAWAVEAAPALTDREIVERLTRLETRLDEGLQGLRADIQQLREDMNRQDQQLREDMNRQIQQLREDMNQQFAQQFRLTLAVLGAFTALVVAIIGFALWDRRTMIRPFERTVKSLEEDLSTNRQRVEALLEALRSLGQRDPEVANVLKQFNLL